MSFNCLSFECTYILYHSAHFFFFRSTKELDAIFEASSPEDRQQVVDYFLDEFLNQFLHTLEELLASKEDPFLTGNQVGLCGQHRLCS